jgi:uncharacterized protein YneR
MKISISNVAIDWFKEEMGLTNGDYLKFFAKIYGSSPVQDSYALGFAKEDPIDMSASTEVDGIIFFVEVTDEWFFNGHDLHVDYNEKKDELEFSYTKPNS